MQESPGLTVPGDLDRPFQRDQNSLHAVEIEVGKGPGFGAYRAGKRSQEAFFVKMQRQGSRRFWIGKLRVQIAVGKGLPMEAEV